MTTNLGRILPIYRGNWVNTQQYNNLDIVTFNNKVYICLSTNTNKPPTTNTNNWQLLITGIDEERLLQIKQEILNELKVELTKWR